MATLEVRDGQGRVRFVELQNDHPVLFGASASCEVGLAGEGVLPVHGRIRWKGGRFKIEASPDAEFVVVNGHKMSTSSLIEGDVVTIGSCRIIMRKTGEERAKKQGAGAAARGRGAVSDDDEGGGLFERGDWAESLEDLAGKERPRTKSKPSERPRDRGQAAAKPAVAEAEKPQEPKPPNPTLVLIRQRIAAMKAFLGEGRPGDGRLATSPLVIGLAASLVLLIGLGLWLRSVIVASAADRLYNTGIQNYEDGDFRTAIRDLSSFLADNPKDRRGSKARTLRAFANVRQYVSPDGSTWSTALEAAHEMVDKTGGEEAYRDVKMDLADVILRIGEGLADRSRASADRKLLDLAEDARALHAQVAGEPGPERLALSQLPSKLVRARAAVEKAEFRARLLGEMNDAIAAGSAARVYQARDELLDRYSDLARDLDLIRAMTAANELVRKAVTVDPKRRSAEHTPRSEPLGTPLALAVRGGRRAAQGGSSAGSSEPNKAVFALADGYAIGLDGSTGKPLWQRPVGLSSRHAPQAVPGDDTAVVFDARTNELERIEAHTGKLIWRLEIGEPVDDPPLVLGNQLVQVLSKGDVLFISLESGELQSTLKLGRPLSRTPVGDESGRNLYVFGRQDCLFVISRDPLGCAAVEYLGHADGSIPCAPGRFGRFLVIPENESLTDGLWHVWVVDENGLHPHPVQDLKVSGWTWDTPASAGAVVWSTGDRGGVEAFSVGDYAGKNPFRPVARVAPDDRVSGPAFGLARSERELWLAGGHPGLYALDLERGKIDPKAPFAAPGPARAPLQQAPGLVVATFTAASSGGAAIWGLDAETGEIAWQTQMGMAWPTPIEVDPAGTASLIGRDGRRITITAQQAAQGGFLETTAPVPGRFALPEGRRLVYQSGKKTVDVVVPHALGNTLWVETDTVAAGWKKLVLPADLAAAPVVWGGGILAPGRDQRVYLVDPISARPLSEPFIPRFNRDLQGEPLAPAILDGDSVVVADSVGRVRRLALKTTPTERLTAEAETTLDKPIIAPPASTGSAVIVATADGKVRALAARDLSPVGSWPLDAPLTAPPIGRPGGAFVTDQAGGVMAFDKEGRRVWSINLGRPVMGAPAVRDQAVVLATSDGVLHVRNLSDGGARARAALGDVPAGGVFLIGGQPVLASGKSALRAVAIPKSVAASH